MINDKRLMHGILRWNFNFKLIFDLLLVAQQWLILFVTTRLIAHHSIFDSVPVWSDELSYWHEVLSFSQKGLNFGYYSINEVVPTYLSFETHGFGTISVYALFGKFFGWKTYSVTTQHPLFCFANRYNAYNQKITFFRQKNLYAQKDQNTNFLYILFDFINSSIQQLIVCQIIIK